MSDLYEKLSEERKEAQEKGLYPDFYSTGAYQMFKSKYLYQAEGFKGQAQRIAKTAARHLKKPELIEEYEEKFFNMIWKGWLSCSTPILANMGTDRGMPVSCSGTIVGDSIESFYDTVAENAVLTQNGFGTAAYLGNIRPRGSDISKGGKAAGILPVMNDFRQMSMDVSQGGVRRGSIGLYIPIDHGDFWEAVNELEKEPESLNIGWCVSDEFVSKLKSNDEDAHKRFARALKVKMVLGKGYFFFPDKVNRHNPEMYKDKGLEVKTSQLCNEVTLYADEEHTFTCQPSFANVYLPDGRIKKLGHVEVGDMIWSSEGPTRVTGKVSSGVKPVFRYTTSAGNFVGTEDHRVLSGGVKIEVREAESIDIGLPLPREEAYTFNPDDVLRGLLIGDGTYRNGKNQLCVGDKDGDYYLEGNQLTELIAEEGFSFFRDCKDVLDTPLVNTYTRKIPDEIFYGTQEAKASFLRGLFSANASVRKTDEKCKTSGIVLKQSSHELCLQVQEMLFSLGMKSKIHKQTGVVTKFKNGSYETRDSYHLGIYSKNCVSIFRESIGFIQTYKNDKIKVSHSSTSKNRKTFAVVDKEYLGDFEVFHIEVDNKTHTYNTGALNVSNCVLSSLNLAKYNEWKDTTAIKDAIIFLDCVASEFIEKAKGIKHLEKAVRFTEKSRALGLGVCGFHTYLMQERIPYESFEAHMFNNRFFAEMKKQSLEASKALAQELGEPEWCKGYGVRGSHTLAIAPTKSTALLMGGVSEGINPDPAMVFNQMSAAGEIQRVNPVLLNLMKEKGVYTKSNIQNIIDNRGSVQHVSWLDELEKKVFKTAFELDQRVVMRMASIRGQHLDQWQSWNLFFAADESPEYIAKIHQEAFLDEGVRGMYYVYSKAGVVASKDECESCQ